MAAKDDAEDSIEGVLVIDKPTGPTSHDVVGKLRRTLRMKRIGHAGTLDPMASGVLVMLLGQATKLGPYLTLHDKRYDARVLFGRQTDSLDVQGTIVAEAEVPDWLKQEIARLAADSATTDAPRIRAALEHERARKAQTPPAYSAIKVDGQRSYDRARRGEEVVLEDRPVDVKSIDVIGAGFVEDGRLGFLDVSLDVSKGYYVRSWARDLGQTLGVPSSLGALRRTRSGPFELEESAKLDAARHDLAARVVPMAQAVDRCMAVATLTPSGVVRASQGKLLSALDFSALPASSPEPFAWLSPEGALVAIGEAEQDGFVVRRGFPLGRTPLLDESRV
ncbi:MAG TPA: tRNA pseudouridine(55) synthase TruB [Polyangium sp.]|nr:tRNA pseudouridine(55) synthase TruB [Polyangium sp.]